ncbi:thioredoxin domain-containing protein [Eremococcus coleocola]|uniref:Putative bacteriocin transport accessory protein n=1 Tax=Eremococcus coleocola ACS-139-V-Col8 TaxID=908337 RepID=E4KQ06_9LACT|nr:thioredoxin domain-containing protein [Eremococcus coleocola]EFR31312.1 putative bacteriocin transport accessory protein [Eremococcus coleocola ACS-139-V-Col8]
MSINEVEFMEIINKSFETVTANQAGEYLAADKEKPVFVGRPTCPYCRKFILKLKEIIDESNQEILFVNSENKADQGLAEFRDKYNIKTVPGFLVAKQGEVKVKCDSSMPIEEIKEFIG